jgi:hypothetical protein
MLAGTEESRERRIKTSHITSVGNHNEYSPTSPRYRNDTFADLVSGIGGSGSYPHSTGTGS